MIETECVGEHVGQDASDKQQAESFTKWVECVAKKVENGEFGNGGDGQALSITLRSVAGHVWHYLKVPNQLSPIAIVQIT